MDTEIHDTTLCECEMTNGNGLKNFYPAGKKRLALPLKIIVVNAVLYRYRIGIPWRDLPKPFGDFRVIHTRMIRWSKTGVWEQVFQVLSDAADFEYAMIDSTIVRAHQHSAEATHSTAEQEAIGRSKGGLSTKIHAVVDALGNPFFLTEGQASDLWGADVLLPHVESQAVLSDKAYEALERVRAPLISL